jgi:hypothetical protein
MARPDVPYIPKLPQQPSYLHLYIFMFPDEDFHVSCAKNWSKFPNRRKNNVQITPSKTNFVREQYRIWHQFLTQVHQMKSRETAPVLHKNENFAASRDLKI